MTPDHTHFPGNWEDLKFLENTYLCYVLMAVLGPRGAFSMAPWGLLAIFSHDWLQHIAFLLEFIKKSKRSQNRGTGRQGEKRKSKKYPTKQPNMLKT